MRIRRKLTQILMFVGRFLQSIGAIIKKPKKKYYLGIYAVMKNEGHILKEWIETHMKEGVEHFYLVDHGSTDDWRASAEKYLANGLITIIETNELTADEARARRCGLPMRECRWVLILDLDEFTYSKDSRTVADYLRRLPRYVSQVKVPWYNYGTSGNIDQPKSVVHSCKTREDVSQPGKHKWHCKSLVRSDRFLHPRIHSHVVLGVTVAPYPGNPRLNTNPYIPDYFRGLEDKFLIIQNHYNLQSRKHFDLKARRLDAWTGKIGSKYTECYFLEYEKYNNQVVDLFLYKKYQVLYDSIRS